MKAGMFQKICYSFETNAKEDEDTDNELDVSEDEEE
jgi:hypothetical protein